MTLDNERPVTEGGEADSLLSDTVDAETSASVSEAVQTVQSDNVLRGQVDQTSSDAGESESVQDEGLLDGQPKLDLLHRNSSSCPKR